MKVVWLSHQLPREDAAAGGGGLLPGRWAGGAEMLQEKMRSRAPAGLTVEIVDPRSASDALEEVDGDRLVVAAPEGLRPAQLGAAVRLAGHIPTTAWLMSIQPPTVGPLLAAARTVLWASDAMRGWHGWAPDGPSLPGWFDTTEIPRGREKEDFALWAARDHPQKGRLAAITWAARNGRRLELLTDAPRPAVLEAMGRAAQFVFLPASHDPCPTTLVEAEIAGCEIITNGMAGRVPVSGADAVAAYVEALPGRFWDTVAA